MEEIYMNNFQKENNIIKEQKDIEIHNLNMKIKTLNLKMINSKTEIHNLQNQIIENKKKIKENSIKINNLKIKRNQLNKISHGNKIILYNIYNKLLNILIKREMSLQSEINLYLKVISYYDRYEASVEAEEYHNKIKNEFEKSKDIFTILNSQIEKLNSLKEKVDLYNNSITRSKDKINQLEKNHDLLQKEKSYLPKQKNEQKRYNNSKIMSIKKLNKDNDQDEKKNSKHTSMRLSLKDLSFLIKSGTFKKKNN